MKTLELSHAQQRLDWEGRIRETEKIAYSKQQQALNQLTQSRNQVSMDTNPNNLACSSYYPLPTLYGPFIYFCLVIITC